MRGLAVFAGMPSRLAAAAKLPARNHLHEQRHVIQIQHDCSTVGRLKSRSAA